MDRKNYIKNEHALFKYIEESANDEEKQRTLRKFVRENDVKTIFLVRDELRKIETEERSKDESAIQEWSFAFFNFSHLNLNKITKFDKNQNINPKSKIKAVILIEESRNYHLGIYGLMGYL